MNLKENNGRLRAIDLAKLIVILFPAFRDQVDYHGRRCQLPNVLRTTLQPNCP